MPDISPEFHLNFINDSATHPCHCFSVVHRCRRSGRGCRLVSGSVPPDSGSVPPGSGSVPPGSGLQACSLPPNTQYKEEARPFAFDYAVNDHYTGTNFARNEQSDGHNVQGYYSVALPDGRTQHVKYTADHYGGYNAEVTYDGEATFPEYHPSPAHKAAPYHPAPSYKPVPYHPAPSYKPTPYHPAPSYKPAPTYKPVH